MGRINFPYKMSYKGILILFVLGFFLGPLGDVGHVYTGIAYYPQDVYVYYLDKIPFWVPIEFGIACVLVGWIVPFHEWLFIGKIRQVSFTRGIVSSLLFVGHYLLSSFLPGAPGGVSDVVLWLIAIAFWFVLDRSKVGFVTALGTMLLGTLTELTIIYNGHFNYYPHMSNLLGLAPSWLPALYFSAGVGVGNLGRYLFTRSQTS